MSLTEKCIKEQLDRAKDKLMRMSDKDFNFFTCLNSSGIMRDNKFITIRLSRLGLSPELFDSNEHIIQWLNNIKEARGNTVQQFYPSESSSDTFFSAQSSSTDDSLHPPKGNCTIL